MSRTAERPTPIVWSGPTLSLGGSLGASGRRGLSEATTFILDAAAARTSFVSPDFYDMDRRGCLCFFVHGWVVDGLCICMRGRISGGWWSVRRGCSSGLCIAVQGFAILFRFREDGRDGWGRHGGVIEHDDSGTDFHGRGTVGSSKTARRAAKASAATISAWPA